MIFQNNFSYKLNLCTAINYRNSDLNICQFTIEWHKTMNKEIREKKMHQKNVKRSARNAEAIISNGKVLNSIDFKYSL